MNSQTRGFYMVVFFCVLCLRGWCVYIYIYIKFPTSTSTSDMVLIDLQPLSLLIGLINY